MHWTGDRRAQFWLPLNSLVAISGAVFVHSNRARSSFLFLVLFHLPPSLSLSLLRLLLPVLLLLLCGCYCCRGVCLCAKVDDAAAPAADDPFRFVHTYHIHLINMNQFRTGIQLQASLQLIRLRYNRELPRSHTESLNYSARFIVGIEFYRHRTRFLIEFKESH